MKKAKRMWALARGTWAGIDLFRNPTRLEDVWEITGSLAVAYPEGLAHLRELLVHDPQCALAFRERRRVTPDLDVLAQMPLGTLGRTFADHMRRHKLDAYVLPERAAGLPTPELPLGEEYRFFRMHIYDTHDVWHVVTGFDVDVAGELGLQAFGAAQTPYGFPPLIMGLGLLNTAILGVADLRPRMEAICKGWEMGKRARPLFGVRWDQLWTTSLAEVRRSLDVDVGRDRAESSATAA